MICEGIISRDNKINIISSNVNQLKMEPKIIDNPLNNLKAMQEDIVGKLDTLLDLNIQFRNRQEKNFLKIFLNVMDRMSQELSSAEQQFKNIDNQIQKDEQCVQLTNNLMFFKNQALTLKTELTKTEHQLEIEKQKQKQLMKQKFNLQSNLFQKSKQILKYKKRAMSLKIKTQQSEVESKNINIIEDIKGKIYKNSVTGTKISKQQDFLMKQNSEFEQPQMMSKGTTSQIEFRIKAAKMSKQRKLVMNRTFFSGVNPNMNRKRNLTMQILQ